MQKGNVDMFNHYIKVNDLQYITDYFSDGPHYGRSIDGYKLLREDGGYQFRLFSDGEENPTIMDDMGVCLYTLGNDGVINRRVLEDIATERAEKERQSRLHAAARRAKEEARGVEITELQLALVEIYETMLGGE